MSFSKTGLIVGLASCLTLHGCGGSETESTSTPEPPPAKESVYVKGKAPRDIAIEIEASKPSLRSEVKTGRAGKSTIIETRYFVGNTLVLVEEIVESASMRLSESSYYIDDDRLAFFSGRGTRTIHTPDAESVTELFDIELGFDPDGNLVDAVKIVNGEESELERFDVEAPQARARMLLLEDRPQ